MSATINLLINTSLISY